MGINEYLDWKNVDYYVGKYDRTGDGIQYQTIHAPLYRKSAGTITLYHENMITTIRDVVTNPRAPDWALWELK